MKRNSNRLLILTYHRVIGEQDWHDPDEVDAEQFEMHVDAYAKYFNVLDLSEAMVKLHNGGLPKRAVSITFDDGYKDNVLVALPILKSLNISATFFIATGFLNGGMMWNDAVIESIRRCKSEVVELRDLELGRFSLRSDEERKSAINCLLERLKYLPQRERDTLTGQLAERLEVVLPTNLMMDTSDVLLLRESGMEIGAHTRSHPILSMIADEEANTEILGGKRDLEQIIGVDVNSFAYPNGRPGQDYDLRHVQMVRNAGFRLAVSTSAGGVRQSSDVFQLGRLGVWDRSRPKLVLRMLLKYFSAKPATVR